MPVDEKLLRHGGPTLRAVWSWPKKPFAQVRARPNRAVALLDSTMNLLWPNSWDFLARDAMSQGAQCELDEFSSRGYEGLSSSRFLA